MCADGDDDDVNLFYINRHRHVNGILRECRTKPNQLARKVLSESVFALEKMVTLCVAQHTQ